MPIQTRRIAAFFFLALLSGCAGSQGVSSSSPRVNRSIILEEQIRERGFTSAYEAVEGLRSNWLRPRGTDSFRSPGQVQVYYGDTRLGGVETLRSISAQQIAYIRYYDGTSAAGRWGLDHGHGVIYISALPLNGHSTP